MLKICGSLLVIGSFLYTGAYMSSRLKKRVELISDFITALEIIKSEIFHKLTSIPEALLLIANQTSLKIHFLFQEACEQLSNQQQSSFESVWQECISKLTIFSDDDKKILLEIGIVLGRYDADTQVQTLESSIERLCINRRQAEYDFEHKGKLYKALSVGFGIILVLMIV